MLFHIFSFIIAISSSRLGGWQTVPVDHSAIQAQSEYLKRNIPHLFPELENGLYEIASAKIQVVKGLNIQLIIKGTSTRLLVEMTLHIDLDQKTTISRIKRAMGSKPILGGWRWQNPKQFTASQLANTMELILKKANILMKTGSGEVLVYRTKMEDGIKTHVVFEDAHHNLFSAITTKDPQSKAEDLVKVYQIF